MSSPKIGGTPESHNYQVHSDGISNRGEDLPQLNIQEQRISQVSKLLPKPTSDSESNSKVRKIDKSSSFTYIQDKDSISHSQIQKQLQTIQKLVDNPQTHIRFYAQLQIEIKKYESLLMKEGGVPLFRYVALSILRLGSSPVFKAKAINSNIDMSDGNFKAVLSSLQNPGVPFGVKNLVCQLGKEKGVYSGTIVNGFLEDRIGCIKYSDRTYVGPVVRDRLFGTSGIMRYKNGSSYSGPYSNGKPHGSKGLLEQPDGAVYYGEFKDGKFDGFGQLKYLNGDVHTGPFKDGKFQGEGKLTLEDGSIYEGPFKDGKFDTGNVFGARGVLKKGEAVYTGRFSEGRLVSGTILIKDKTYTGGFDKEGNFIGTVSVEGGLPKKVRTATKAKFQGAFKLKQTPVSDKSEMIRKVNEMIKND